MGVSNVLGFYVVVIVTGFCLCQEGSPSPSSPSSSSSPSAGPAGTGNNATGRNGTEGPDGQPGGPPGGPPPQVQPVWLKCVAEVTTGNVGNANIAKVLEIWCQNYEQIIECLSRDIETSAPTNPLDFFINLTFEQDKLRTKSEMICSKREEMKGKLSCAESTNDTLAEACANRFSGGLYHVFTLHKENKLTNELLRDVACDVTLQTTFCLRDTLPDCEDDIQTVLLNYYSLFTNETCVAQQRRRPPPETVVSKCAREAAQTLSRDQAEAEPTSLLDFLVLGLKTDCKTYKARYACYERELDNITNFRDFWLSLTFDHDNALASQQAYCDNIEERIIPQITHECFNKSQPGLAACETGFGREVEAIREEWFNNSEFDGVQLQTLACRTSVTRAACLDNAMRPCGEDVSRAMAVSEMGILPNICRRLLAPQNEGNPPTGGPEETHPSDPRGDVGLGGNMENNGGAQAGNENDPRSTGNYRPAPRPTSSGGNEKPMSDQAPSDQEKGGQPMQDHPGYGTKASEDKMGKTTDNSSSKKNPGHEHGDKNQNDVSASRAKVFPSKENKDNGAGIVEGVAVIVMLQTILTVGVNWIVLH